MKGNSNPANCKYAAITLAIIDLLVVAIATIMFVNGRISDYTFWVVMIVAGLVSLPLFYLTARGITAGIKSPQEQAADDAGDIPLADIKLPRSVESTLFEVITGALVIAATAVAIATHFQYISGRALAGLPIITSWLLISAYTPTPSFLWGEVHNMWQARCSARLRRILALMFASFILLKLCNWIFTPQIGNVTGAAFILTYIVGRIIQISGRNR